MTRWRTAAIRFLRSLALVLTAYFVYSVTIGRWIDPPSRSGRGGLDLSSLASDVKPVDLSAWFPVGAWELGRCKRLDTPAGHVFFRDYQTTDDGQMVVSPLTLLLRVGPAMSPEDPPLFVRCPAGAILKIDGAMSLGGKVGQLVGGRLQGEVRIERPATPGRDDAWQLVTRDVQINKQRIQTLHDVEFHIGPHQGAGRNLRIDLASDPLRAGQRSLASVRGVQRIELVQLARLTLAVPADQGLGAAPTTPAEAGEPPPLERLEVACRGPMTADLQNNRITIGQHVTVTAVDRADDWLAADQIELALESNAGDEANGSPGGDSPRPTALRSLTAHGTPAILNVASRQLVARGEQLGYDLVDRRILIGGRSGAALRQGESTLEAASLEYQLMADGSLGPGRIAGPGRLVAVVEDAAQPLEIAWSKELAIEVDGSGRSLSLVGAARVGGSPDLALRAEALTLWIQPAAAGHAPPAELAAADAPESPAWQLDRLFAHGSVVVQSTEFELSVEELKAQWLPAPEGAGRRAAASAPASAQGGARHAGQHPPADATPSGEPAAAPSSAAGAAVSRPSNSPPQRG